MLDLCEEKLRKTLQQCLDDDVLLAHLIDETMIFDKELQLLTPGQPEMNCIKVLLEEENLKHWIDLEKKCLYLFDIMLLSLISDDSLEEFQSLFWLAKKYGK